VSEINWRHQLPRTRPVDREDFLVQASAGKHVIHLGFTDHPILETRLETGTWLHARLAKVASHLVGIDVDADGVAWANRHGFESHQADACSADEIRSLGLEPAELVLAPEIIEHLDAPGPFLRAIRPLCAPNGKLILTTLNAYRALHLFTPLAGVEINHPDHVAFYTPPMLKGLFERTGWTPVRVLYAKYPRDHVGYSRGVKRGLEGLVVNTVRGLGNNPLMPYWADALIAVAKPR
jgi:hypothetical protein